MYRETILAHIRAVIALVGLAVVASSGGVAQATAVPMLHNADPREYSRLNVSVPSAKGHILRRTDLTYSMSPSKS